MSAELAPQFIDGRDPAKQGPPSEVRDVLVKCRELCGLGVATLPADEVQEHRPSAADELVDLFCGSGRRARRGRAEPAAEHRD
jgi:hypothetical protein